MISGRVWRSVLLEKPCSTTLLPKNDVRDVMKMSERPGFSKYVCCRSFTDLSDYKGKFGTFKKNHELHNSMVDMQL